jgi:beta-hydroxylase
VERYKKRMKKLKHSRPVGYRIGKWALHLGLVGLVVVWAL